MKIFCDSLKILLRKCKTAVAFLGKDSVRTKIIIADLDLKRGAHFNYLVCDMNTYDEGKNILNNIDKYGRICSIVRQILKRKTIRESL